MHQQERDVGLRTAEDPPIVVDPTPLLDPQLSLEDLAQLAGMTARNVRAYQQRKLLPLGRRVGRRLVYDWDHLARLRLIRALHSRGLSLKVIEDLIARGAAEAELARINTEATPGWTSAKVPVGEAALDLIAHGAHSTRDLLEAGVVHLEHGQIVASSAALGVAGALLGQGVALDEICRIVLLASRAAREVSDGLNAGAGDGDFADIAPSTVAMAARLAAIVFNEQLLDEADRRRKQVSARPRAGETSAAQPVDLATSRG